MAGRGFDIDRPRDSQETLRDSLDFPGDRPPDYEDNDILDEHEEAEKLLTPANRLQRLLGSRAEQTAAKDSKRYRRLSQDVTQEPAGDENFELMHDADESGSQISAESSDGSLDLDREKLAKKHKLRATTRKGRFARFAGIHMVILGALGLFLLGAVFASRKTRSSKSQSYVPQALSNGTSLFQPTTLLISLDGFRADMLNRNITPHLNALVRNGVSPEYMLPSFPSVTFPNHFTLVTGLYPESHGVVGNSFWDPELQEEFYYTDPARSMFPRFWLADPVWTTAELSGIRTAIHMWPGSEAHIGTHEPTYVDNFNKHEPLQSKVDRVLGLLDLPDPDSPDASETSPRPQLIAAYVPNVDADGHLYGPNSTEIFNTIGEVDAMVGRIMAGLDERNLTSIVNVVIVSDHGMATTSTNRLIQLDDLIDMSQIEHTDGWPLYGLRPKPGVDLAALHADLVAHAAASNGTFEVYLRDTDMPARYHFSASPRIAPLWLIPATGWNIVTRVDFDVAVAKATGQIYHPRGVHGYDHENPLMRAIFIARGPAFPHPPGSRVKPFQNTEVYGLVCDSLGLTANPNNGTLRLPLETDGLHEAIGMGRIEEDLPADDVPSSHDGAGEGWAGLGELPQTGDTAVPTPAPLPEIEDGAAIEDGTPVEAPAPESAEDDPLDAGDFSDETGDEMDPDVLSWWQWFIDKVESVKTWASGTLTSHKGEGEDVVNPDSDRPIVLDETQVDQ